MHNKQIQTKLAGHFKRIARIEHDCLFILSGQLVQRKQGGPMNKIGCQNRLDE